MESIASAGRPAEIAHHLAHLPPEEVRAYLQQHPFSLPRELAWELKEHFDAAESSAPDQAIAIAQSLELLADFTADPVCAAVAAWTRGMADQLEGNLAESLASLARAEAAFDAEGDPHHAAETLISKLFSLAMLGRYDEALRAGLRARSIFLAHDDLLAAGKIEQNLGNLYFRRDEYRKAEQLYWTARKRFLLAGDAKQLAQIDNCLASALTWQHRFQDALALYDEALARATAADLQVTQAEIESNLGGLMLFQARYDRALDYLERARRRYAGLGLEQDAAISEKELAEAYLELNLIPEAQALLERLRPTFAALGMQAELADVSTGLALAYVNSRRFAEAQTALAGAHALYEEEQNALGAARVKLVEVQRLLAAGSYIEAVAVALDTEAACRQGNAWEWLLRAQTLRAEALRRTDAPEEAAELYAVTLAEADRRGYPQIELRCLVALGTLDLAAGAHARAQARLDAALATYESLRALLPSEEFRRSFRSDQADLFDGLVTLSLAGSRTEEAWELVERARSHTLLELVEGAIPARLAARDAYEMELLRQVSDLRSELHWFYHQLHRLPGPGDAPGSAAVDQLRQGALAREGAIATLVRQLQHRRDEDVDGRHSAPLPVLQDVHDYLGSDTALIEYYMLQNKLLAFVACDGAIHCVELPRPTDEVEQLVGQLRFQIDTLRSGGEHLQRHMDRLTARTNHYLAALHAALIEPLLHLVHGRRLVVVPSGALHYAPFQAFYSGTRHLIEEVEVCVAPSAGVLLRSLQGPTGLPQDALLVGAPDERTPLLEREITALHALMPTATVRVGAAATVDAVRTLAPHAGLLHLACHAQFRPDNPMFSALRLADGWLTAHDAYDLQLNCSLVTLSACETGVNAVTPGDELLGLVRGFLAGGAQALLVSLWPVDDATTVKFMQHFYTTWQSGGGLGAAHRAAQRALLADSPHPFFWSPFVLFGRWS
jgi:CHAT domain-containing protein/tetratricopeptide (TPR) repeat protein